MKQTNMKLGDYILVARKPVLNCSYKKLMTTVPDMVEGMILIVVKEKKLNTYYTKSNGTYLGLQENPETPAYEILSANVFEKGEQALDPSTSRSLKTRIVTNELSNLENEEKKLMAELELLRPRLEKKRAALNILQKYKTDEDAITDMTAQIIMSNGDQEEIRKIIAGLKIDM